MALVKARLRGPETLLVPCQGDLCRLSAEARHRTSGQGFVDNRESNARGSLSQVGAAPDVLINVTGSRLCWELYDQLGSRLNGRAGTLGPTGTATGPVQIARDSG